MYKYIFLVCFVAGFCDVLQGPDPWHHGSNGLSPENPDMELPPDLKAPVKMSNPAVNKGHGDWWFRRILTIVLKSGQVKQNDDASVVVSLQMRFEGGKWNALEEYLQSDTPTTDVMFRRSVGFVEEAIYKPSITDKIKMAWSNYIQDYLMEYKIQITWACSALAVLGVLLWLWQHMSHKHVIAIIFVLLYIYEVIISYKEAEQQELDKFLSAVNTCKWYFWTTDCPVPAPDPLIFMKHMNPLKIGIRMFTSLISEPIIALNSTIKLTILSMTDGLWFPFDKILYGILIVVINISLLYLLVMIVFNFIFNIPFNLSFLGIVSVGVAQRTRTLFTTSDETQQQERSVNTDRISSETLISVLNVVLDNVRNTSNTNRQLTNNNTVGQIRRSASTGRLPNVSSALDINTIPQINLNSNVRKRNKAEFLLGAGDQ